MPRLNLACKAKTDPNASLAWDALAPLWDIIAWPDVALPELRGRLIQRWLDKGLSRAVATRRVGANDMPDTQLAIVGALMAELIVAAPLLAFN
jgi:pantothenate kinase